MAEFPLTTRQCSILSYLLKMEGAISTAEIATQLKITPRMVRYDLHVIENWLDKRDISIERKPGSGIQITADENKKALLIRELQQFPDSQIILSHNERQELLLFLLLTNSEPVVLKQLKLKLGVSRSTILQDLDKTETWLGMHGLFLIRRPSFGFQVEGKVIYWCEALIAFLLDKVGVMPILALCIGSRKSFQEQMQGKTMLSRAILEVFSTLEIEYCASLVSATQRALNVRFTDNSFVTLVLQIALQIIRLKQGGVSEDDLGIHNQKEIEAAQQIASKIEQRYNLTYPDDEKAYLSTQLYAARSSRSVRDIRGDDDSTTHDEAIMDIVSEILTIASEYLHPYLKIDRELERSLLFHLEPVMERLRINMPIRNPLLNDVKHSYRYIYEVASRASEVISKVVGKPVPEEEIGYLAMHLGAAMERLRPFPGARKRVIVVCSEGVATAWLLVSRLRAELPNIDVDEVMPALEVQKQAAFDESIDAIISILPLKRNDIPVIVVNPLLRMKDVALIRKTLGVAASISVDKEVVFSGSESTSLATLLREDTVALQIDLDEWHKVVELAVGLLVKTNGVEPMYSKAIEDLVINHGPYMVIWPGVALLHGPPKAGVKRLCMSLVTLKEPVVFGHAENDPVDIVFALGAVEGFTHRQALEELNELVNDPVSLHAIRTAESHGQIIQTILRSIQALNG